MTNRAATHSMVKHWFLLFSLVFLIRAARILAVSDERVDVWCGFRDWTTLNCDEAFAPTANQEEDEEAFTPSRVEIIRALSCL